MGPEACRIATQLPTTVTTNNLKTAAAALLNSHTNGRTLYETPEAHTRRVFRMADAVCFDVDSTVCQDEAIDELAAYLGKGEQVAKCTQQAMGGGMSFREALRLRLNIMKPTRKEFEDFIESHPVKLTPGIARLVDLLQSRGTHVYLVSGGFRKIILKPAKLLGIPPEHIYANELEFDEAGHYTGFDVSELTSDSGSKRVGKAGVCALLKQTMKYKNLVMIGDGATDAEACPPADAFIGFGGNQVRESIKKISPWYVYDFQTLIDEIACLDNFKN